MKMLQTPFYDPKKTFEENFEQGPFGAFADGEVFQNESEPEYNFLGFKVNSPFGIPAGPLVNSKFIKAAFHKGFDICVYKTVRANAFPCHPYPNVVPIEPNESLKTSNSKVLIKENFSNTPTITNSFGVPSRASELWQEDIKKAISYARTGQILVLSFMGTVREGQSEEEFIEDHRDAARKAMQTGAKVLEVNFSCPNIGNEGLVCYNLPTMESICKAIREEIGDTPLIIKIGYYQSDAEIKKVAEIAEKYANAVGCINSVQSEILNDRGEQAIPGEGRLKSGVCGAGIKSAGLEMVRKFKKARQDIGGKFQIIGMGGVMNAEDFLEYRNLGADIVMSATGAMWNPYLAKEIKERLR